MSSENITSSVELPKVSIIIPTHNRSKLLCAAVDSALAQTHPHIEVIVVDDGATDDTEQVMARYTGRITYIKQPNQGVAAARNRGLRAATGKYITFLDDDDLILPSKIARQVEILESCPETVLVHCGYYFADQHGRYLSKVGLLPEGNVLDDLLCGNFVWLGSPLIPRWCLDRVGDFDETVPAVVADWDLWLRIALMGYPFACVQEPLGVYRVQPDSMVSDVSELAHGMLIVLDKVFSDPTLTDDIIELRPDAYGSVRFWLGCRFFAAGRWNEGRRNLAEALWLSPSLLTPPKKLAQLFCDDALSGRVEDPFQFISGIFDNLPHLARDLRRYQAWCERQVRIGLVLRDYALGNPLGTKHVLSGVVDHLLTEEERDDFVRFVSHNAMHLPEQTSPIAYINAVFAELPSSLAQVRLRVLSEVSVGLAFEAYAAGHWRQVLYRVLLALWYRPDWLRNRGVLAIFFRSLWRWLSPSRRDLHSKGGQCPAFR